MADTEVVASGLLPHQKDEHDIWICKDCGWKYPNAKPSPKIRKNHKKHCPAKAGGTDHGDGASDGEQDSSVSAHTSSPKPAENEVAREEPQVESKDRSFDIASILSKNEAAEGAAPFVSVDENGGAKGVSEPLESLTKDATAEKQDREMGTKHGPTAIPETDEPPASDSPSGSLMLHQKDEHDIWICNKCGWKYPNAKPSAKVRKHHKKACPGSGGRGVEGAGSSDDASDDEHHGSSRSAPKEASPQIETKDRSFDIGTIISKNEATEAAAPFVDAAESGGPKEDVKSLESLTKDSTAVEQDTEVSVKNAPAGMPETDHPPVAATPGGLMPYQKDEHDIWICKDCGWKYPNAKPSAKVRKHHKKTCPGKGGPGARGGGSSDDASDDEHHAVETSPEEKTGEEALSTEVPTKESAAAGTPAQTSRDLDFSALTKEPAAPDTVDENSATAKSSAPKTEETNVSDTGPEDVAEEGVGGLMPHQKDENDIWVCKECGWKYPNAKPSPKVRSHHKKKCPGAKAVAKRANDASNAEGSSGDEMTQGGKCFPCL